MENFQDPLVPSDVDCTDLDGFMLNVERLMASELVALATHEEVAAALFLWCRAWKQTPAASLPDDDRINAAFSRLSLARFKKVKDRVLHGFVKCSDGRLYHRFLAAEAVKAFERKAAFKKRRDTDAERLRKWREGQRTNANETHDETKDETRFVAEGQGQGQGQVFKKKEEDIPPLSETPTGGTAEAPGTSTPSPAELTAPRGVQPPEWDDETVAYLRRNSRETAESVRAVLVDLGKSHGRDEIGAAIDQARCSTAAKPLAFVGAHLARLRAASPLAANSPGMPPPRRSRLQHLDPKFLE